jgi:PAS domain S-box-containing protein
LGQTPLRQSSEDLVEAGNRPAKPAEIKRERSHVEPTSVINNDNVDLTRALEELTVPAYVLDREGTIRWLNRGAVNVIGDRVGERFVRIVAPEDLHRVRMQFAKKLIGGTPSTEYDVTIVSSEGRRLPFRIASVPLHEHGKIVGVFGVACPSERSRDGTRTGKPSSAPELTARQYQVLALLADGKGTQEISSRLGVADETARNHIRGLLRQLDAHSRLEAVATAYRLALLPRESA